MKTFIKTNSVLFWAIVVTLIVDATLIFLVYQKTGAGRLPLQIGRLFFQIVVALFILLDKSKTAIFVFSAYHIISGVNHWFVYNPTLLNYFFFVFHTIAAVAIYLHDWFESKLLKRQKH